MSGLDGDFTYAGVNRMQDNSNSAKQRMILEQQQRADKLERVKKYSKQVKAIYAPMP